MCTRHVWHISWVITLVLLMSHHTDADFSVDYRRPFYNMAHMANHQDEVLRFVQKGANAIEVDVQFNLNGEAQELFHGLPCDCFRVCGMRQKIVPFFQFLRDFDGRRNLTVVMLDLKMQRKWDVSAKRRAGVDLTLKLINHLWSGSVDPIPLFVVISIPRVKDIGIFEGVLSVLRAPYYAPYGELIGFDVSMNDPLDKIAKMYKQLDIRQHVWQGDGISNCINPVAPKKRLKQALRLRDARNSYITKVYRWTVDLTTELIDIIALGVDSVITNEPQNILVILNSDPYRNFVRLATREDNPFEFTPFAKIPHPDFRLMKKIVSDVNQIKTSARQYLFNQMGYIGHKLHFL